jgi:hypothetical protein
MPNRGNLDRAGLPAFREVCTMLQITVLRRRFRKMTVSADGGVE